MAYEGDNAILGECKWTNSLVDTDVLNDIVRRSEMFQFNHTYLYIFAKKGFTEQYIKKAQSMNNVSLIHF